MKIRVQHYIYRTIVLKPPRHRHPEVMDVKGAGGTLEKGVLVSEAFSWVG
jgi:hypothetical protein